MKYERIPYLVAFPNNSGVRDVYGGLAEIVVLECYQLKPETPSDTALVFMHPIGGGAYLPMINALARAGHHVIYCNSRFRGTDSALLMEKVVEDLGEERAILRDRDAVQQDAVVPRPRAGEHRRVARPSDSGDRARVRPRRPLPARRSARGGGGGGCGTSSPLMS